MIKRTKMRCTTNVVPKLLLTALLTSGFTWTTDADAQDSKFDPGMIFGQAENLEQRYEPVTIPSPSNFGSQPANTTKPSHSNCVVAEHGFHDSCCDRSITSISGGDTDGYKTNGCGDIQHWRCRGDGSVS